MPKEKFHFNLRLSPSLHERVKKQAEKESRSTNAQLVELIKRGLESKVTKQLRIFED